MPKQLHKHNEGGKTLTALRPENTRCPNRNEYNRACAGGLFREAQGADRLSERLGRIVVVCDRCGVRVSIPLD